MGDAPRRTVVVILWQWPNGNRFLGCHNAEKDARVGEWERAHKMVPIAAARVTVVDGEGLDIVAELERGS